MQNISKICKLLAKTTMQITRKNTTFSFRSDCVVCIGVPSVISEQLNSFLCWRYVSVVAGLSVIVMVYSEQTFRVKC